MVTYLQLEAVELPAAQLAELEAIATREDWGWITIGQAVEKLAEKKAYAPNCKRYEFVGGGERAWVAAFNAEEVVMLIESAILIAQVSAQPEMKELAKQFLTISR